MDLTSLLTTIISSTAALVAIIGGFLVSRVISISSEHSGIKRRLREINNDIGTKKELIVGLENYLFEDDLNDFVIDDDSIELMIQGKELEDIVHEIEYDRLTIDELRPYFEQLKEIKQEMFDSVDEKHPVSTFQEFNLQHGELKYPDRILWYKRIFEVIIDILSEPKSPIDYLQNYEPANFYKRNLQPTNNYGDKEKERDQLKDEVNILKIQKEEQEKILEGYGRPRYVMSGLIVLGYATVVGICYPSTLLPYLENTYDDVATKWLVLILFFSLLLAIFSYLTHAMIKLGKTGER